MRPWTAAARPRIVPVAGLQWGHGLAAVDGAANARRMAAVR